MNERTKIKSKKITSYETSIDKLNKEYDSLEKDKKIPKDVVETAKKEKDLQKEVTELSKQIKTMDSMLNGYQRENERMITKENMQKKEIDQYQTELQEELRRNQQLQQQLLRKTNQVLISDDTIDLNKTNVSNLILGGEILDLNDLSELKNKNK